MTTLPIYFIISMLILIAFHNNDEKEEMTTAMLEYCFLIYYFCSGIWILGIFFTYLFYNSMMSYIEESNHNSDFESENNL